MGILAGAIGGFGTGLGRGLEQMQSGVQAYGLQQADRAFQMERLAEQNRFQAEQGDLTRKSAASNSEADRAQQLSLTDKKLAADLANTERTIGSNVNLAAVRAKLDIDLSKITQETALAAQKIQDKIAEGTIANNKATLKQAEEHFQSLRPEVQDVTATALIKSYASEMTRLQATVAKLTADGLPIPDGLTKEMNTLVLSTKAMHKVIEGHMPKEAEIKMPGATTTPQEKVSLLDGAVPQPVGTGSVLRPGGVPVEQPAAAAVVSEAEPVRVPLLERMAMPRGGRVPPEKITEVNTHNLNVEVQNLIADVNNTHRSPAARKYDMTQLEALSKDSRLSEAQRVKIMETITQSTGDIRTGAR